MVQVAKVLADIPKPKPPRKPFVPPRVFIEANPLGGLSQTPVQGGIPVAMKFFPKDQARIDELMKTEGVQAAMKFKAALIRAGEFIGNIPKVI